MGNKPPTLYSRERGRERAHCCYCKRDLGPPQPEKPTSLTWDHVRAESDGGWKRVPCCRQCNFLKGNTPPDDWFWFIGAHPRWWKEFTNPSQVTRVIREFRFAQAKAGARPIRRFRNRLPYLGEGLQ
jgi:hypothetical protein